jgi:hypothetical protein
MRTEVIAQITDASWGLEQCNGTTPGGVKPALFLDPIDNRVPSVLLGLESL